MICNSLKSYKEIYKNIWAMPKSPLWNNYALAWQRGISKYFLNSVLVTGSTIVGAILVSALASYFWPASASRATSSSSSCAWAA